MVYKILIPYGINFVYTPTPIISISLSIINTNVNSMAKKLKQGQKYPKGFTQTQILLKLCEKDRTPTSEILDFLKEQFYIREQKNIREHHLKILEKQKLIRRESAGRGHPDYWSVIPDFRVLKELVDRLKHDPDSQHKFMLSQYYRNMASDRVQQFDLVHQFVDSIPDNDMWKFDTHQHTATREQPLTEDDKKLLTDALRSNWLTLKFVTHFISVDTDERTTILQQLMESIHNSSVSPAAAKAIGYTHGFCLGMDECQLWIKDDKKAMWFERRKKVDWDTAPFGEHIRWRELFDQLDHLNSNYRYLFD